MSQTLESAIYTAILEEGGLVTNDKAAADIAKLVSNLIENGAKGDFID